MYPDETTPALLPPVPAEEPIPATDNAPEPAPADAPVAAPEPEPNDAADTAADAADDAADDTPSGAPHEKTAAGKAAGIWKFLKKSFFLLSSLLTVLLCSGSAVLFFHAHPLTPGRITEILLADAVYGYGRIQSVPLPPPAADAPRPCLPDLPARTVPLPDTAAVPEEQPPRILQKELYSPAEPALANETPYQPDLSALLREERVIPPLAALQETCGPEEPVVLLLHTHATEAFSDTADSGFRSTDTVRSVVFLGAQIAAVLEENGIPTLHLTTLFDADDFTMAYYNASLGIRQALEEHPSIAYIVDIHRDSILSDQTWIAPVTQTPAGEDTAQMMFVIGTDYGGSGHTSWEENLSLALRLQQNLNEKTPHLMRNIHLRSASFNEQYSSGSLLLEIGSCASTQVQASRAAALFAEAFVQEIRGNPPKFAAEEPGQAVPLP